MIDKGASGAFLDSRHCGLRRIMNQNRPLTDSRTMQMIEQVGDPARAQTDVPSAGLSAGKISDQV
jgi:hypothetical protein